MTDFTDEQREQLKERLASIDRARAPILKARAPLDMALHALDEMADEAEQDAGVEVIGNCETCDKLLVSGDLGHQCDDGPTLCEACAPTWNDIAEQYPRLDAIESAEAFERGVDGEVIEGHIAAGDGEKKHVWPL